MSNGVQVTPDQLKDKLSEIEALDEKIEAASGGDSGGRISLRNEWIKQGEPLVNQVVEQVIAALDSNNATPEFRAGVYFGLGKALKTSLGETSEKFLDEKAEERKAASGEETPQVSVEELTAMRETRKGLVTQYHALRGILEMFGQDVSNIGVPKILRGAVKGAKRGPRKINLMKFTVDGVEVPEDKQSLSGLAEIIGGGLKAKDVRKALKDAGVDTANPKNFEVTIGGKSVVATGGAEDTPAENSEAPTETENTESEVPVEPEAEVPAE